MFPLGDLTKQEIREMARAHDLSAADKPDSQDFYSGDPNELIGAPDRPGDIVGLDGKVLGRHMGFWHYTIGHRTVYGGGGIMPDYFVPLDTTQFTTFHRNLVAKNVVLEQDLKFMDSHRKELKKQYPDFASYMARYEVPQSLVDAIIAEGKKQKVEPKDAAELKATLPYLRLQLKALIARDVWDMSEYFQIMNEQNKTIQQL